MTSMVICHQKIMGHITPSWNIQAKAIGNFEKDIYLNHLATVYTGLASFQVTTKETYTLKWLHPSFLKSQMDSCSWQATAGMAAIIWKTVYAALTHGEDEGLKSLLCHICCRTWVSWYTSTGVGQFLAAHCSKIDGSQIWRASSNKSVMTWALCGVALLSCKVWHLVPWLAEQVGRGGTQSHSCSVE